MPPKQVSASSYTVVDPFRFYAIENRSRVDESVLDRDHDLRRRIRQGEDKSDSDDRGDDYYDAEDELYERSNKIMRKEYDEETPESEKARFQQMAVEERSNTWRRMRAHPAIIFMENEESLKQKEEDEKNGITGPIPVQRTSGAAQSQVTTGTFVGGEILTPAQALTPPFDRDTLKMKTGKIEAEEYF